MSLAYARALVQVLAEGSTNLLECMPDLLTGIPSTRMLEHQSELVERFLVTLPATKPESMRQDLRESLLPVAQAIELREALLHLVQALHRGAQRCEACLQDNTVAGPKMKQAVRETMLETRVELAIARQRLAWIASRHFTAEVTMIISTVTRQCNTHSPHTLLRTLLNMCAFLSCTEERSALK